MEMKLWKSSKEQQRGIYIGCVMPTRPAAEVQHAKAYLNVTQNPKIPLHGAVPEEKRYM